MTKLERLQNKGLRIVTGQYTSSPLEAVRKEADVTSYSTASKRMILRSYEKALRSPADHPKQIGLRQAVPKRTPSRSSWAEQAQQLVCLLPEACENRLPLATFTSPPWKS